MSADSEPSQRVFFVLLLSETLAGLHTQDCQVPRLESQAAVAQMLLRGTGETYSVMK